MMLHRLIRAVALVVLMVMAAGCSSVRWGDYFHTRGPSEPVDRPATNPAANEMFEDQQNRR